MTATHGVGTTGDGAGTVTTLDHKMAQSGLIVKTSGNAVRAGLFWGGTTNIVTGKADMTYDVAAFTAALSRGATAGTVLLSNDGTYNVATTAAPGSNSRYDVVYLWQREFALDGTDSDPVIGVVQGTAAAPPTVPSLAAFPGAISLAEILVPAGVTATNTGTTITQKFPITTLHGGREVFPDTAARDRSITSPAQYDRCWIAGVEYEHDGSDWTTVPASESPAFAEAAGSVAVPLVAAGAVSSAIAVTFPTDRFDVAPLVVCVTESTRLTPGVSDITTTGCNITVANWSPGPAGANSLTWVAVQMTDSAAAG